MTSHKKGKTPPAQVSACYNHQVCMWNHSWNRMQQQHANTNNNHIWNTTTAAQCSNHCNLHMGLVRKLCAFTQIALLLHPVELVLIWLVVPVTDHYIRKWKTKDWEELTARLAKILFQVGQNNRGSFSYSFRQQLSQSPARTCMYLRVQAKHFLVKVLTLYYMWVSQLSFHTTFYT